MLIKMHAQMRGRRRHLQFSLFSHKMNGGVCRCLVFLQIKLILKDENKLLVLRLYRSGHASQLCSIILDFRGLN